MLPVKDLGPTSSFLAGMSSRINPTVCSEYGHHQLWFLVSNGMLPVKDLGPTSSFLAGMSSRINPTVCSEYGHHQLWFLVSNGMLPVKNLGPTSSLSAGMSSRINPTVCNEYGHHQLLEILLDLKHACLSLKAQSKSLHNQTIKTDDFHPDALSVITSSSTYCISHKCLGSFNIQFWDEICLHVFASHSYQMYRKLVGIHNKI